MVDEFVTADEEIVSLKAVLILSVVFDTKGSPFDFFL